MDQCGGAEASRNDRAAYYRIPEIHRAAARDYATLKCAGCGCSVARRPIGIARALLHQMERRLELHITDRDWFKERRRSNITEQDTRR
jgi:hypothetical protein